MDSSSASASYSNSESSVVPKVVRSSSDVGWKYGSLCDPNNLDKVKCNFCPKVVTSGIYRLKQHIAQVRGQVSACPSASDVAKRECLLALGVKTSRKRQKNAREDELREEVDIVQEGLHDQDSIVLEGSNKSKSPHLRSPMNAFLPIKPDLTKQQQSIHDAISKQRAHEVHQYLARWVYEVGIPFNSTDTDSFKLLCEAIGQYGPSYKPPSQYLLRERLLDEEVVRTKNSLKRHEEELFRNGCSIMTDAWSDRKRRSIMNLCVNCKEGTTFLSSKEDSMSAHTGEHIFEYVDKAIDQVGSNYVIQVVTDNASNNMKAKSLLHLKRPTIFWTSCATHMLNLMLQGIGNLKEFKSIIDQAKAFAIFVYAHDRTLALMRKHTTARDIVRPGVTRFATSYLTLESLLKKKAQLALLVASDEWDSYKPCGTRKGKEARFTILSRSFWKGVRHCLDVFKPLFLVLKLVDGDKKPSMGFIFGELEKAKQEIVVNVFKNVENDYRPILDIIEAKGKKRLDSPLHLAAYLLNPHYLYNDESIGEREYVMDGFMKCVTNFFPNPHDRNSVINEELLKYKDKDGRFGSDGAKSGCSIDNDKYNPVGWWSNYGGSAPNLQKMAKRILSLTSSASGCERNWSTFESVHTKKRNRLNVSRLNNLVYVQFNARLINKRKRAQNEKVNVMLANEASKAQGWIVDGGDGPNDEFLDAVEEEMEVELEVEHEVGESLTNEFSELEVRELDDDPVSDDGLEEEENDLREYERLGEDDEEELDE